MSFDFELVPDPPADTFPADAVAAMSAYWARFPTWSSSDGTLVIFPDRETRALALERYQRQPGRNDYTVDQVKLDPQRALLSVVGDEVTDRWLYEFTRWCQERWPSELRYMGEPVPPEDLLGAIEH